MLRDYAELACVYRKVAGVVRSRGVARRMLHRVLTRDGFARKSCLREGRGLVEWLASVCEAPLADEVDRAALAADLVRDVGDPDAITQGSKGTCAAAAVQILLAAKFPAEYARLVLALAAPDGTALSCTGARLAREPGTAAPDDSGRRLPSRLLQPAFMEYANDQLEYCNERDMHYHAGGEAAHKGLFSSQQRRLLEAVTGGAFRALRVRTAGLQPVLARVAMALDAGHLVPCGVDLEDTRHAILVRRLAADQAELYDSWGRITEMEIEEFSGALRGAMIPAELLE